MQVFSLFLANGKEIPFKPQRTIKQCVDHVDLINTFERSRQHHARDAVFLLETRETWEIGYHIAHVRVFQTRGTLGNKHNV